MEPIENYRYGLIRAEPSLVAPTAFEGSIPEVAWRSQELRTAGWFCLPIGYWFLGLTENTLVWLFMPVSVIVQGNFLRHFFVWNVLLFTEVGFQGDHGRCYVNGTAGISFLQTGVVQEVNGFFDGQSTPLKTEIEPKNERLRRWFTLSISGWISSFSRYIVFVYMLLWRNSDDGVYPHCPSSYPP